MKTFEEKLETVSAEWVGEGLIGAETRAALLARHPATHSGASRMLTIFTSVGGALFVAGISLVIKANWDQLGDWLKIGGVVALLVGAYTLGWRLKISPGRYPKTGDACLMVAAVLFLLGIALVSQIFHLESRPSNGVLLWWVGIAAVPWLTRAKGVQFVSVFAGLTWLGMEFEARDSWLRLTANTDNWHSGGFYLFAAAGFPVGAALLLFGVGLRGGRQADFAGLHEKLGLGLMCWALYSLGFTWSAHNWSGDQVVAAGRWQPAILLMVLALLAAVWARMRNRDVERKLAWLVAPGLVPVVARLCGLDFVFFDTAWLWGGLACAALFGLNIGMIRTGLADGRESWINLGIAGIALNVFTRYFVLFGTMLEGGVFFIVTGLLVIGLGYGLERKRRSLVGEVRKEATS